MVDSLLSVIVRKYYTMNGTRVLADNVTATLRELKVKFNERVVFVTDPRKKHLGTVSGILGAVSTRLKSHRDEKSISFTALAPGNVLYVPDIGNPDGRSGTLSDAILDRIMTSSIRNTDSIFTNSKYMRQIISDKYDISLDNVFDLPLPIDDVFTPEKNLRRDDCISFLTVGKLTRRRIGLLDIPSMLRKAHGDKKITYYRAGPRSDYEGRLMAACRQADIEYTNIGDTPNRKLVDYYRMVNCYVYLSEMEGYSLTPKEALACGTPALISHNPVHDEIYGGKPGVVWFDGFDSVAKACEMPHSQEYSLWTHSYSFRNLTLDLLKIAGVDVPVTAHHQSDDSRGMDKPPNSTRNA